MTMWPIYTLLILLGIIALLLFLIMPGKRRDNRPFIHTKYAHRGLHSSDGLVPENSIAAFKAAATAGYGVELDVQLTADQQVVVFHDADLKRMCGIDRRVDELTYAELSTYRLLNSDQHIPLLEEVLECLGGATLLCELKPMRSYTDTALCDVVLPLLDQYKGAVCVESFNPLMLHWFKKNAPHYIRGILSKKFLEGEVIPVLRFPLASLFTNCLCRPDFVAYQHTDSAQPFFHLCKALRAMTIAWTVQSAAEEATALQQFDTIIFEGYLPDITE